MKKETYAGKVKNTGNQIVQPPISDTKSKSKTVSHKGKDLRSGK